jgi:hypothetical protein
LYTEYFINATGEFFLHEPGNPHEEAGGKEAGKKRLCFFGSRAFFVSGEYSDLDEAGVPNCFHFSVLKS